MAIKDKEKWNKKYKNTPELLDDRPQSYKLADVIKHTKGLDALDVACGSGRNSIFLANNDFKVTAIDISEVALDTLNKKNNPNVKTKLVDLDTHSFDENKYDLIIMTNFLDRNIIPKLTKALKKDGVLFIETYMFHEENEKPPSNPDFLLKEGELKTFFDKKEVEILEYDEFFNESFELYKMRKQSIVIRKK
ncbi:tellurium resistance protein TehB [Arcobacter sp. CECT 8983]|uniref:methyltransferase domain-containing protein n=1 Tax=Arcobacter sp. CECT 8983 TaxID=2044508 RepID=UPI00100A3A18|nr:methyltransferase domain-containing protein [Arcobacter sp. CECT 8983]RXJ90650.1 tellurium resistance protein TehB [Arcobacter sp. CECT 8983]